MHCTPSIKPYHQNWSYKVFTCHEHMCIQMWVIKILTLLLVMLLPRPLLFSCSSKSSLWGARPEGQWWTRTSWPRTRWKLFLWWLHTRSQEIKKSDNNKEATRQGSYKAETIWHCAIIRKSPVYKWWWDGIAVAMQSTALYSSWFLIVQESPLVYCTCYLWIRQLLGFNPKCITYLFYLKLHSSI